MAGFNSGDDEDVIAGINVTPLVDIVLVLLIIFMVTTSYIVKQQIKVDLPKAASGESEVQSTLTFKISEDGVYFLDGNETTLEQIGATVKSRLKKEPESRAIIAADKKVDYGKVVDLIDTIKQNGLDKFALNIEKKQKATP
ncbi:biopolymer transporter ExbD [Persicimonas caeni]|uniref:Biopolymer transporter ExbD n=1 Tax=Persicimonas caeni TaxID=2292766 RepID=A0A4Y6Q1U9_PERCE|nr:biopolymer transporter ExbD [Persicimonas caeni]QDG54512.1 biopolymer transporter ExbD [Persicimonas caeni]QED35733.1 biopolymer transporter ExbD [Persicimonas caeni]